MLFAPSRRRHIVAVGHSHLSCLEDAYRNLETQAKRPRLKITFIQLWLPQFQPNLVDGELNENVVRALDDPAYDAAVTAVGGSNYVLMAFLKRRRPFDFVLPEAVDAPICEDAEILPYEAVRRRLARESTESFEVLSAIRATTTLPLSHLESPPPISCEEHIRAYPRALKATIEGNDLPPASLRWKLWRLQSENYRRLCKSHGSRFIPAPKEMQDEQGFLVRHAWPDDPVHANERYGEAVYRQLESLYC